jgi:hypothetical protein
MDAEGRIAAAVLGLLPAAELLPLVADACARSFRIMTGVESAKETSDAAAGREFTPSSTTEASAAVTSRSAAPAEDAWSGVYPTAKWAVLDEARNCWLFCFSGVFVALAALASLAKLGSDAETFSVASLAEPALSCCCVISWPPPGHPHLAAAGAGVATVPSTTRLRSRAAEAER